LNLFLTLLYLCLYWYSGIYIYPSKQLSLRILIVWRRGNCSNR